MIPAGAVVARLADPVGVVPVHFLGRRLVSGLDLEFDIGQTSLLGVGEVVQDVVLGGALEDGFDLFRGRGAVANVIKLFFFVTHSPNK